MADSLTGPILKAAFRDTSLSFDLPFAEEVNGGLAQPGATPNPNGDLTLTIVAPEASVITVTPEKGEPIALSAESDAVFSGVLPYDAKFTGPRQIEVHVDGVLTVHPSFPVIWSRNRPCNVIEIPDRDSAYLQLADVPHGAVAREIYWSAAVDDWRRCMVYTPPGYQKGTAEYPVLYLLNGFTDNELSWIYQGRLPYILDNAIAAGEIEPFIVVMNNGMTRHHGQKFNVIDDGFERMLVEDCIPFIEDTYRVHADKWNRAIAGLSMGAYMASDIGLAHPELFGYLGTFTASMTHETLTMTYERPYMRVMQPDNFPSGAYRVFFRSTTPAEDHLEYFEADDLICEEAGVTTEAGYVRILYSSDTSKWNSWRRGLHDFSRLIFK